MKNHGNAPSPAQYAEFAGIVQSKLWPAVKDRLSKEEMQALVTGNGPKEVLKRLRKAFAAMESEGKAMPHQHPFFANDERAYDGMYPSVCYPTEYAAKPTSEQLVELEGYFPYLDPRPMRVYSKNLTEHPKGAENPFIIPNWKRVADCYDEAIERVFEKVSHMRPFESMSRLEPLRLSERTAEAERIITSVQGNHDYILLWAQFGLAHCNTTTRRVRAVYAPNEFGLGSFAVCSMLLTHPKRFVYEPEKPQLMPIVCPGDERSPTDKDGFPYAPVFEAYFTDHSSKISFFTNTGNGIDHTHRRCFATAFLPVGSSA